MLGDVWRRWRQKAVRLGAIEADDVARRQGDGVDVDGERRRRHDGGVAGPEQGQAHVAEHFLGAQAGEDFGVRDRAATP